MCLIHILQLRILIYEISNRITITVKLTEVLKIVASIDRVFSSRELLSSYADTLIIVTDNCHVHTSLYTLH